MYKKRYFHGQADPKGRVSQQSFTEAHTFITTQIIQQHLFHLFEDSEDSDVGVASQSL